MSMKKSNDTIENRTRDLPARTAALQPTAPPRAPSVPVGTANINAYFQDIALPGCLTSLATSETAALWTSRMSQLLLS
jgi:hypothetical protein